MLIGTSMRSCSCFCARDDDAGGFFGFLRVRRRERSEAGSKSRRKQNATRIHW